MAGDGKKRRIIRAPAACVEADLSPSSSFSERLIAWQKSAGRHDLPWQNTRDPYRIWLSEIMLQQTQVATVIPYYQRFLASFPDVRALAAAPVEIVMEHWAGLGYYARARNLHRCAQQVVAVHGGSFPASSAELEMLPGIGRSTAAAVAAFAFGERAAILDGNVKRVLCRHFAVPGFPGAAKVHRQLWQLAERLLPASDIEAYTQGLMDLGAGTCTRSRPSCPRCPLADDCLARRQGRQATLPEARPRAAVPERSACFVLIRDGQRVLLERRPPSGLWGGLLVPPEGEVGPVLARFGLQAVGQRQLPPLRHSFTHFRLTLEPVLCDVHGPLLMAEPGLQWVELAQVATAAVPAPIGKLLRQVASAPD
ncbi:MAG: A/G-specific adenine glycosylase [Dechloromonas sp.]|nr:MAG: A/G-specific adenine glycosylase [Dechloromonas sp.]